MGHPKKVDFLKSLWLDGSTFEKVKIATEDGISYRCPQIEKKKLTYIIKLSKLRTSKVEKRQNLK